MYLFLKLQHTSSFLKVFDRKLSRMSRSMEYYKKLYEGIENDSEAEWSDDCSKGTTQSNQLIVYNISSDISTSLILDTGIIREAKINGTLKRRNKKL